MMLLLHTCQIAPDTPVMSVGDPNILSRLLKQRVHYIMCLTAIGFLPEAGKHQRSSQGRGLHASKQPRFAAGAGHCLAF